MDLTCIYNIILLAVFINDVAGVSSQRFWKKDYGGGKRGVRQRMHRPRMKNNRIPSKRYTIPYTKQTMQYPTLISAYKQLPYTHEQFAKQQRKASYNRRNRRPKLQNKYNKRFIKSQNANYRNFNGKNANYRNSYDTVNLAQNLKTQQFPLERRNDNGFNDNPGTHSVPTEFLGALLALYALDLHNNAFHFDVDNKDHTKTSVDVEFLSNPLVTRKSAQPMGYLGQTPMTTNRFDNNGVYSQGVSKSGPEVKRPFKEIPNKKRPDIFEELTPGNLEFKPDVLITVTHPDYGTHQWWYRQTIPIEDVSNSPKTQTADITHPGRNDHQNQQTSEDDGNGQGTRFYNENEAEMNRKYQEWEEFVWKLWKPLFFQHLLDLARSTVDIYFFPTDANKNGEIDVLEELDTDEMYYQRPRADIFQPINARLLGQMKPEEVPQKDEYKPVKSEFKSNQGSPNELKYKPLVKAVRMDDDTSHRVPGPGYDDMRNDISPSPYQPKASPYDDEYSQYNDIEYGKGYRDEPSERTRYYPAPERYAPYEEREEYMNPREKQMSPTERHDMIQTLWPDAGDSSDKLDESAKQGRIHGGIDPYTMQQQHLPINKYADVANNAYGFNTAAAQAGSSYPLLASLLAGNYNDGNDIEKYQAGTGQQPKQATVNQLWPGAYSDDRGAYPYIQPKSQTHTKHHHQKPKYTNAEDAYAALEGQEPPTHHVRKHKHPVGTAKEGYSSGGYGGSKGYDSKSSGYGSSGYGGHSSSSGYGGHSSSSGYGHSSGSGYGDHGMSGYGHSSGGYGGGGGGGGYGGGGGGGYGSYGKVKKWEGGEKKYGSGKKGTKGSDSRDSHKYTQGKWSEKNKDSRKIKGNKVKTYSYGGHGWYKEETNGEENGAGNKDAHTNHEDWTNEKGKHEAQEKPYFEFNSKNQGYHKDLGYHKK